MSKPTLITRKTFIFRSLSLFNIVDRFVMTDLLAIISKDFRKLVQYAMCIWPHYNQIPM